MHFEERQEQARKAATVCEENLLPGGKAIRTMAVERRRDHLQVGAGSSDGGAHVVDTESGSTGPVVAEAAPTRRRKHAYLQAQDVFELLERVEMRRLKLVKEKLEIEERR